MSKAVSPPSGLKLLGFIAKGPVTLFELQQIILLLEARRRLLAEAMPGKLRSNDLLLTDQARSLACQA